MSHWSKVRVEFNEIVNRHFDSPEYHRLFSVKLTPARKQIWIFTTLTTSRAGATAGRRR